MKKSLILFILLGIMLLACTACKDDTEPTRPIRDNSPVTLQPNLSTVPAQNDADTSDSQQEPTDEPTAPEEPTEAPTTLPAAVAEEKYRNEYTANGLPSILYEVVGTGENARYSGVYLRHVYNGNMLMTVEKWNQNDSGDSLISTTDYGYDGRGHLTRTEERLPDNAGNLYTYCLTEIVNNADGKPATKSISMLNPDGSVNEQTVYGYTYDEEGREILCTVTEDGSFTSRTETAYVSDGNTLTEKTVTTIRYPDTPYEQRNVVTQTFDSRGNVLTHTEDDTGIHYTISYEYDAEDREVSSRTTQADGTALEYTMTEYDDLGGGFTCTTKRFFAQDGSLSGTQITYTDSYGNAYIPQ